MLGTPYTERHLLKTSNRMNLKIISLIGLGIALLGLFYLIDKHYVLSKNPITIAIQLCALGLMIWARLTFGIRSFHATANTTKGGLVTNGPYRWLRHPIYASIIYFFSACLISYPFIQTFGAVALIIVGLFIRMFLEEKFLAVEYKEYATYCQTAKRVIPFLF
jgi:protein-S-isoprenylcysteine O-methyltransferase Ste14